MRPGVCDMGNDLIDVHVGLRTAARLKHDERKLIIQHAGQDLFRCLDNGIHLLFRHLRQKIAVCQRTCLFEISEGVNDLLRHLFMSHADREILPRPLRLRTPETFGRHLHFSQRIALDPVFIVPHPSSSYSNRTSFLPNC